MCFHSASGSLFPLSLSLSLFILHSTFFPSASRPLLECFPPLGRLLLCFQGSRAFLDGAQCQIRLLCQARTLGLLHLKSVCILSTAKKTRGSCSSITGYLIRDGFSHGDNAHIFDLLEGWACSSATNGSDGNLSGRFFPSITRVCRSSRRWTESLIARLIKESAFWPRARIIHLFYVCFFKPLRVGDQCLGLL